MKHNSKTKLPQIPNKRYFTIGEVGHLCCVKPHVLRYWEQEFPQLRPAKRRGNRRYYQREDVVMVRNIRGLLYDEGYTISGARVQLDQVVKQQRQAQKQQQSDSLQSQEQQQQNKQSHNEISYSYKFTVDVEPEESISSQPEQLNAHEEHYEHEIYNDSYNSSYTASEPQQSHKKLEQSTTYNQSPSQAQQEHKKLTQYKIILSEVIVELRDILEELREDTPERI